MNPALRIATALGIATVIAAGAEGIRQKAYRDPVGVITVCYGSTTDVDPRRVYSLDECRDRLDRDMLAAIEAVERCAPGLPPHVMAALGDAIYNIGEHIVCDQQSSTLARRLAAGDVEGACRELLRWNRARVAGVLVALPGLTKRREAEMRLCLG
jgi:lysozyme